MSERSVGHDVRRVELSALLARAFTSGLADVLLRLSVVKGSAPRIHILRLAAQPSGLQWRATKWSGLRRPELLEAESEERKLATKERAPESATNDRVRNSVLVGEDERSRSSDRAVYCDEAAHPNGT
ncbi:hypothetical protein AURDEDRAFT_176942 [Auricularia subglabra TFB-10046 SS5]|uniref:Uncharacterized protein n=1 Tax=Auricularia subglabra (strain TFB-10046 / SS5) TaxID=717982 RepID=J0CUJ8_AURST|nr:hypothetical protein AURDEDRAFT_176942 [Auricularia subglabra TFB-10046 SS5]